jgi:hypothetical protein
MYAMTHFTTSEQIMVKGAGQIPLFRLRCPYALLQFAI